MKYNLKINSFVLIILFPFAVLLFLAALHALVHYFIDPKIPATAAPPRAFPEKKETVPSEKTITIRSDYWFPFVGDPDSASPGYMVEVAKAVFEKAGYRVDYKTMPWARAVEMVREGKLDALIGAFKTDVPDFVFPEADMGIAETVFLVKKGSRWRYQSLQSLQNVKIGIVKEYGYGKVFDEYVRQNSEDPRHLEVIYGENVVARNLRKLSEGKIDATLDVRPVLESEILKEGLQGQFVEAGTISSDRLYVAFSPSRTTSKAYAEIITKGIVELRESGELKIILDKYGFRDWK